MPLAGVGLVLTICGAACVFGFLGGLTQRCYMQARSRSAAYRDHNRAWPAPSQDIELGPMGGGRRAVVFVDGELAVQGPGGRVWHPDAEAHAANGREERAGMGWSTA
ncbi:hypothetical protein VC83_06093 [Pseudogymnoascus destructans]|uniref:Uncharacterized protein n=1 Tax=Pseudogymnoascus destructans TaxID=655981 RepID=A0A177A9X2_9PEZI|nr:uncharacterized protein VC83_06093 [Pseudogymnoascus destructans]OAF58928.1 hypothetical protein VC83_06093 [Pseudogymnoascus destructans]